MTSFSHIEIKNLYKYYDQNIVYSLNNVNLRLNSGIKYGLLGPNGAGKTSLISILCGLMEETKGFVKYHTSEGDVLSGKKLKSAIGFVPQDFAFYNDLSAIQNLNYFGAMYDLQKEETQKKSNELLSILNLSSVAHKKVKKFSGGMKRRLNLAIGLLHNPSIIFLDEPTEGLDVQGKQIITQYLNQLNTEGKTIIYTTHQMNEAQNFCEEIILINKGLLLTHGKTHELLNTHNEIDLQTLFIKLTAPKNID